MKLLTERQRSQLLANGDWRDVFMLGAGMSALCLPLVPLALYFTDGKVKVAKKHEASTRHGAWQGLAVGALTAILPGIGLGVGAAAGAGIGAVTGHIKGGMKDSDLKQLGEVLDKGSAGLIVIYATNMADQVSASLKATDRYVSDAMDVDADALAKQIQESEK